MNEESRSGPAARVTPPRQRIVMKLAPVFVALAFGALIVASATDVLTPATPVRVSHVVFERTTASTPPDQPASEAGAPGLSHSGVTVQAPGWLEAEPFLHACTALADGVVEEILVLEGDRVQAGQVVARLVDEDARLALDRAEAQLAAAKAELALARADRTAAATDWEHPIERERAVNATRAALAETKAELEQLPALIAEQQAMLERQQEELKRSEEALEYAAATNIEVIVQRKQVEAQQASLEATRLRQAILEARADRLEAEVEAAQDNAELRIAERRALDVAEAAVVRAEAALAEASARRDEARLRLDRMKITAPITGYVQRRLKLPGDKIMLGMDDPHSAHVLHLYDPERIQVRVDVPLADARHIYVGQRCEVIVDILPETTFAGEVLRITHEADLQKNTLQTKVRVINPSPLLRPEMLTRVKFLPPQGVGSSVNAPASQESEAPVLRVSTMGLVDRSGNEAGIWVVRNRRSGVGVARRLTVNILEEAEHWATVQGPLRESDLVVVNAGKLNNGQRVRTRSIAQSEDHTS